MSQPKNNVPNAGGISFLSLLTTLFIGLKLTGYVDWSWWWVLAPLWIPVSIGFTVAFVCLFIYGLLPVFKK